MDKYKDLTPSQKIRGWLAFFIIVGIIATFLIVLPLLICSDGDSSNTVIPSSTEDKLEVISWHWSRSYGYITVEGEVKNISGQRLENVMAVVVFRTEDREYVKSADALIDYNPIMPGQISPFTVMTTSNPLIKRASLSFKEFWGSKIPHKFAD